MAAPNVQAVSFGRRPQPKASALSIDQEVEQRLGLYEPLVIPSLDGEYNGTGDINGNRDASASQQQVSAKLSKVKTSHVLIFMSLHIGSDPPDYVRIEPCAKLECWTDPSVAQARCLNRGSEGIADALEQQYRLLHKDAVYKKVTEVTIDDAKMQLSNMRRKARDGRVLFHYNGHGMPKATHLGEFWFFDKDRTHYVPFNINEAANLLESPTIWVFDCNSAGSLLNHWKPRGDSSSSGTHLQQRTRDFMICACSEGEMLPMNPLLPADLLTSCLTTPVKMMLEWYIHYSYRKTLLPDVTEEMIRRIPGEVADRKTPLGELNWIFTAVTDTIAWCTTADAQQFHQLFRQDVLVKSLFRNYLLADKLLREVGCTPVTYPSLPDTTYAHYMWDAWELALESIICQLPSILNSDMTINSRYTYKPTTFFSDQLTAFEVWVEEGDPLELPEQLPCVILALTQISQRVRALTLLSAYLASGPTAVAYAIRCGVLLYLWKLLLQTQEAMLLVTLVWSQLVAVDPVSACAELVKNQAEKNFIKLLMYEKDSVALVKESELHSGFPTPVTSDVPTFYDVEGVDLNTCKVAAAFVICKMLEVGGEKMYVSCWNSHLVQAAFPLLSSSNAELRSWGCLLLSKMFSGLRVAKEFACKEYASRVTLFSNLLRDKSPAVRSSCVTLLASILGTRVDVLEASVQQRRIESDKSILIQLRQSLFDHSSAVRAEIVYACAQIFFHYGTLLDPMLSTTAVILSQNNSSRDWKLDEAQVNIKSALNATRPTDNVLFEDSKQVLLASTAIITRDDPPPPAQWVLETIAPRVLEIIEGLVHDASLMLSTLNRFSDSRLVQATVDRIAAGIKTQSFRMVAETCRTELPGIVRSPHVGSVRLQSGLARVQVTLSEEDRARRGRNRDFMRRLFLDIQSKKIDPTAPSATVNGSPSAASPVTTTSGMTPLSTSVGANGAGGNHQSNGSTSSDPGRVTHLMSHCLPLPHEQIVCGRFRLLEPQVIVAERNNRISVIDYESNDQGAIVMKQIAFNQLVSAAAPIHDMLLINDLSTNPGLVVLTKAGCFTVLGGVCSDSNGRPSAHVPVTEVCSFACSNVTGDLKMGYRNDGHLLYAGSMNTSTELSGHRSELAVVNLVEEQAVQRIPVVGEALVNCIAVHPTGRAVFLGMSDGVVKYYDDRTKTGQVAAVSTLHRGNSAPEPILSVNLFEENPTGASPLLIAATTQSGMRLFDLRQPTQPLKTLDLVQAISQTSAATTSGSGSLSLASKAAASFNTAPPPRSLLGVQGGIYTGLLFCLLSDGTLDCLHYRTSQSQLPRPLKVREPGLPTATFAHPMRPVVFANGDIVTVL